MESPSCPGCRERDARIAALEGQVRALLAQVAQLQARVAELEARLGQHSGNSSKPPSSDGPHVKRRPPREPSGRRRGAQPGHERQQRPPLPPDQIEPLKPTECRRCGHRLNGDDPQPIRHQVIDLPPIQPQVIEYQLHRLSCPCCGTTTCARLPAGVPRGQHGPRLQSLVALLTGAYRLSKRMVQSLCGDVLGIDLCPGTVCKLEQQMAAATEPVVGQLREHVFGQNAHIDETGWREDRRRAWLWVVVNTWVTVFHVARSRGSDVARSLLGPGFHWVLTSDRFSAYAWLALEQRQLCWAHLRRDFQAMIDRGGAAAPIGQRLLDLSDQLFAAWYRVRDRTITAKTFRGKTRFLRSWVGYYLKKGSAGACAKTAAVCRELLRLEPALWTFVSVRGVEPTNNAAERALRHAVLWRKTSHGTDSAAGSLYVARILSVVATCRQQGRSVLDFLRRCCEAHLQGDLAPSLLPQPT
jgi:transposase